MKKEFMFSEKLNAGRTGGRFIILFRHFCGDIVKAAFPNAPAYHSVDELYEQILQYLPF